MSGRARGDEAVDALKAGLRARQGELQLSVAAAESVVKETVR